MTERKRSGTFYLQLAVLVSILLLTGCQQTETELNLGGGPEGGTFQGFAEALASALHSREPGLSFRVEPSAGSVTNLVRLNRGELDLALVYAGDAYLGREGRLSGVQPASKNVRAVTRLYSAVAQLVVRRSSPWRSVRELTGARVAIGTPGSGTAVAAERYFTSVGLWSRLVPIHVGFEMAFRELERGSVDAVWLLVGLPNRALAQHAEQLPLRLLDLFEPQDAGGADLFRDYPFYAQAAIPAGTYAGQAREVSSFSDATLLLARSGLSDERVYQLLEVLFTGETRRMLAARHHLGGELTPERGEEGIKIPMHAGARRFWRAWRNTSGAQ